MDPWLRSIFPIEMNRTSCVCVCVCMITLLNECYVSYEFTIGAPNKRLSIFCSQLIFNENILMQVYESICIGKRIKEYILVTLRLNVCTPNTLDLAIPNAHIYSSLPIRWSAIILQFILQVLKISNGLWFRTHYFIPTVRENKPSKM